MSSTLASSAVKKPSRDADKAARNKADELTTNVREIAEEAGTNVRRFLHDQTEQFDELRKTAETRISDHPLKSVAFAVLGGFILSALLRR